MIKVNNRKIEKHNNSKKNVMVPVLLLVLLVMGYR